MAYTPTVWETGDVITAAKLNKAEAGIQDANADVLLVSEGESDTLNKKFSEIFSAYPKVFFVETSEEGTHYAPIAAFFVGEGVYVVNMYDGSDYVATTEDGYPVKSAG